MSGVFRLVGRPVASRAVIASLVALGYLQQAKRHRADAIKRAIERLRSDLYRAGVIQAGDLSIIEASRSPATSSAHRGEHRQAAAVVTLHSRAFIGRDAKGRNHRMTYIVPEIALATRDDIVGILNLQEQNLLGRGGLLSVRLPGAFIEAALDDLPQIVARRDGKIVAYLLAGSRSVHAQTPIIKAMFRAYSGSHDAYIYGPICVAESERGHGLATALFAELRERLPERESVAFVRRDSRVTAGTPKNGDEGCGFVRA